LYSLTRHVSSAANKQNAASKQSPNCQ